MLFTISDGGIHMAKTIKHLAGKYPWDFKSVYRSKKHGTQVVVIVQGVDRDEDNFKVYT